MASSSLGDETFGKRNILFRMIFSKHNFFLNEKFYPILKLSKLIVFQIRYPEFLRKFFGIHLSRIRGECGIKQIFVIFGNFVTLMTSFLTSALFWNKGHLDSRQFSDLRFYNSMELKSLPMVHLDKRSAFRKLQNLQNLSDLHFTCWSAMYKKSLYHNTKNEVFH